MRSTGGSTADVAQERTDGPVRDRAAHHPGADGERGDAELAAEASNAGALGSLGFATSSIAAIGEQVEAFARRSNRGAQLDSSATRNDRCRGEVGGDEEALAPIFAEHGLDELAVCLQRRSAPLGRAIGADRSPSPRIVSFHFGLPAPDLLAAVKAAGAVVMCSATVWPRRGLLAGQGADVIIAQGAEAGGHRGIFTGLSVTQQAGTMALVPQIVDAVDRPVVAAGGITDGRGIAAALMSGASAVQMGTAFLFCPEAQVSNAHRKALLAARDDFTRLTRLFSGRPARSSSTT